MYYLRRCFFPTIFLLSFLTDLAQLFVASCASILLHAELEWMDGCGSSPLACQGCKHKQSYACKKRRASKKRKVRRGWQCMFPCPFLLNDPIQLHPMHWFCPRSGPFFLTFPSPFFPTLGYLPAVAISPATPHSSLWRCLHVPLHPLSYTSQHTGWRRTSRTNYCKACTYKAWSMRMLFALSRFPFFFVVASLCFCLLLLTAAQKEQAVMMNTRRQKEMMSRNRRTRLPWSTPVYYPHRPQMSHFLSTILSCLLLANHAANFHEARNSDKEGWARE